MTTEEAREAATSLGDTAAAIAIIADILEAVAQSGRCTPASVCWLAGALRSRVQDLDPIADLLERAADQIPHLNIHTEPGNA
jgi:hypothetical protein